MKELSVIKIGGKVIDDPDALSTFLKDFSTIEGPKILVHGGGKIASDFGKRLGIESNYIDGRRITDAETLELVTMVYAGLVNKKIVAELQAHGTNAIGLTGADANVLTSRKRPVGHIDFGFVGDVEAGDVNTSQLAAMFQMGLSPVFCALTHDRQGNLLNTNADTIASVLSTALSAGFRVQLVYCFEQKGVLSDFENKVVIPEINSQSYSGLKAEGIINEGMIPKMDNAFDALKRGVDQVMIGHFSQVVDLVRGSGTGTTITL